MSAPVDVLAVMDAAATGLRSVSEGCSPDSFMAPVLKRAEEMEQARAAVIEAFTELTERREQMVYMAEDWKRVGDAMGFDRHADPEDVLAWIVGRAARDAAVAELIEAVKFSHAALMKFAETGQPPYADLTKSIELSESALARCGGAA